MERKLETCRGERLKNRPVIFSDSMVIYYQRGREICSLLVLRYHIVRMWGIDVLAFPLTPGIRGFEAFGAHWVAGVPRPRHTGAGGLQLRVCVRQVRCKPTFEYVCTSSRKGIRARP